ncbi:MAG: ABC transporter substrate-binding protein [Betaproteobacteria bacterium]|nr:ABC transporter substrate-binding protein [Betaproteobacteria bacterium]
MGAVVPQSGDQAALAAGLRQALLLWQEQTNDAGGLLGRRIALRLLDDHSEAERDGRLYRQLIEEDKADLLVGPFGSAATLVAAAAAEGRQRVLVNATGTFRELGKVAYRYVFQVPAPLASYGAGALAIARQAGYHRLYLTARDDPAARQAAEQTRADAAALGLDAAAVAVVSGKTSDYTDEIGAARALRAQAWIAFGGPQDAANLVISLKRADYAPQMLVAQGAADARFIALVGQDAEYAMGILPYAPWLPSRGNAEFARDYEKKWRAKPDLAAAEGYAAGEMLAAAVRRAGSLDQDRLRDALSALETETVLGPYRVDHYGGQIGAQPAVVQVLGGRRVIVWPKRWASAAWQLPYPAWSQRKPLGHKE